MVPPIWLDESGEPRPVRQCPRCGRDAPIYRFRLEHLKMLGWRLFAPAEYVSASLTAIMRRAPRAAPSASGLAD